MREIEPKVPNGMRLLPALPTLHDVLRCFGETKWVRFSRAFVQALDIPDAQKDFLFWPGLPGQIDSYSLSLNWQAEIQFCMEDGQLRFAELYCIFESSYKTIFIERFTGFLWSIYDNESVYFVASGLEPFFLLNVLSQRFGSFYDASQLDQEEYVLFGDEDDDIDNDDFFTLVLSIEPRIYQSSVFGGFLIG
ncbi:hypothetical protein [Armatimonas rosea]|uniref:Uncharacterized protein n=1 Tax=Armatimonas rosea TaxID=685828 RepID=A0A7W9SWU7_ARMRO|nr:hypothetical protein [Armatimonas rosea]MBB6053414.1 hypothetical protein [Armatimonas rosea]